MQENPYYKPVKEGAITSVKVIANLYSGAVGAVYAVGSGISKGATQVIEAKYGKDAGEASDGVFEGVGNVGKMYRIPVDQAAKQLS